MTTLQHEVPGVSLLEAGARTKDDFRTKIRPSEALALAESIVELAGEEHPIYKSEMVIYEDLVVKIVAWTRIVESDKGYGSDWTKQVRRATRELSIFRQETGALVLQATDGAPMLRSFEYFFLVPHMRELMVRLVKDTQTVSVED